MFEHLLKRDIRSDSFNVILDLSFGVVALVVRLEDNEEGFNFDLGREQGGIFMFGFRRQR